MMYCKVYTGEGRKWVYEAEGERDRLNEVGEPTV